MTEHFHLLKSETLPLTRQFVDDFLRYPGSSTERVRNEQRMKHLASKASQGVLIPFNWAVANLRGVTFRVNGQHSAPMLAGLDGNFPNNLYVHLDTFEVADEDGLALLFRQFDDRRSGRTSADVAGAYQGLEKDLVEVPRPPAKLAVEAVAWYRKNVERSPSATGDDRYTMFHEIALHDFISWTGQLFANRVPEFNNEAVVAAMFATYDANRIEAKAFWHDVANGGDEYRDGAPGRVLSEWLRNGIDRDDSDRAAKITKAERYQGCVYAWNAYRRGEPSIKTIKHTASKGWTRVIA